MKKYEAILLCYGKDALEQNFEINVRRVIFTAWMIEGVETKEELEEKNNKKQIINIYESGI